MVTQHGAGIWINRVQKVSEGSHIPTEEPKSEEGVAGAVMELRICFLTKGS